MPHQTHESIKSFPAHERAAHACAAMSEFVPVTTTIHADRIDGHCDFERVGSRVVRLLPPLPGAWPWHTGDYETFYAGRDA